MAKVAADVLRAVLSTECESLNHRGIGSSRPPLTPHRIITRKTRYSPTSANGTSRMLGSPHIQLSVMWTSGSSASRRSTIHCASSVVASLLRFEKGGRIPCPTENFC